MTIRAFLAWLLLSPVTLFCEGCAAVRPNHVTVFCERDDADTGGRLRQGTTTIKAGVSATYDFPK